MAVVVNDRQSPKVTLVYSTPHIAGLTFVSGLKNESVVLRVSGANLALACSACLNVNGASAVPVCTNGNLSGNAVPTHYSSGNCSALACGDAQGPLLLVANDTLTTPCVPICVDSTTGTSSVIVCRTAVPIAEGNLTVTVAGQTSLPFLYSYVALVAVWVSCVRVGFCCVLCFFACLSSAAVCFFATVWVFSVIGVPFPLSSCACAGSVRSHGCMLYVRSPTGTSSCCRYPRS